MPVETIVSELGAMIPAIKAETVNYYQLCESLEKAINNEVISKFPVIMNSSPECLSELGNILSRHVSRLSEDLVNLIEKAQDQIND